MSAALERAVARARRSWGSPRVRLVALTLYYFAIVVALVALRGAHLPATRFVYQEF